MKAKFDKTTLLGFLIAIGGVLGGFSIHEGKLEALWSGAAFTIVVVGSFGAVLVATPRRDVILGIRGFTQAIEIRSGQFGALREQILKLASLARREGILALDDYTNSKDSDPFLVKCLNQAIDGSSGEDLRASVETDMDLRAADLHASARFWENWGAICPTVGILGAVLGLIEVVGHLDTPERMGPGIASAFVATVYGVGFSNLVCLPIAFKLQRLAEREDVRMSMVLEGVMGIQGGVAPGVLRSRLEVYLPPEEVRPREAEAKA
ncbi:MAG: MotA/TolQ/ExbB proton channel family protein [Planctomycetota bacterium]